MRRRRPGHGADPRADGLTQAAALLKDCLDGEDDGDLVADDDGLADRRQVEVDAPLLAADGGVALERDAGAAPRVAAGAEVLELELDRLGDLADGQVAGSDQAAVVLLEAGAAEGHLRGGLDGEEVSGPQVVVAVGVAGVDRAELDRRGHRGLQRVARRCSSVPSNSRNWPRTLPTRWRTVKPTSEWLGSIVVAAGDEAFELGAHVVSPWVEVVETSTEVTQHT